MTSGARENSRDLRYQKPGANRVWAQFEMSAFSFSEGRFARCAREPSREDSASRATSAETVWWSVTNIVTWKSTPRVPRPPFRASSCEYPAESRLSSPTVRFHEQTKKPTTQPRSGSSRIRVIRVGMKDTHFCVSLRVRKIKSRKSNSASLFGENPARVRLSWVSSLVNSSKFQRTLSPKILILVGVFVGTWSRDGREIRPVLSRLCLYLLRRCVWTPPNTIFLTPFA